MQLKLQSSFQRVAILLFFFGFAYSSNFWSYSTANLRLQSTDISTFFLFTFPSNVPGSISFSVNTSYDIQICFQEYVAPATFSSCDPSLYWSFKANTTNATALLSRFDQDISYDLRDDFFNPKKIQSYIELLSKPKSTQIFTNTTSHFLAGRQYWLAAAYTQNHNATFSIQFRSNTPTCDSSQPYATPFGCVGAPNEILNNVAIAIVRNSNFQYFSIDIQPPQNASYYTGFLSFNFTVAPVDPSNRTFSLAYYIQRNSFPDSNVYDASYNVTSSTNTLFSIPTPLPGTYYIYTYNPYNVSLKVTVQTTHFDSCSLANTTDPRCPVKNVTNPTTPTTSVITGPQYFEFNTSKLIFGVGTKDLTDAPPIYLSVNTPGWPSQYSYMAKAEKNDVNFFDFQVQPANQTYRLFGIIKPNATVPSSTWRVAVVANSSQSYYFWSGTYCPYNCTGGPGKTKVLGTCDQATGKCTCTNSKAGALFCSPNGLSIGWIIVIIIIVIIVVACAIGIPLALWIRQKRKESYERV